MRASRAEVEAQREAIHGIVSRMRPMTVRQVFYQATVLGIVDKTEGGYDKVQTDLKVMRETGALPFSWLADNTRWQRRPTTYPSVQAALEETARLYRKSLWDNADAYVEIWLEKDTLSGVIWPITNLYDVPLMVARGYASLTFLNNSAEHMAEVGKPVFVYHLGDFDPSGVNAGEKIEETLRRMAPEADITFERLGVLPEQIEAWNLPTRPTKASDSRAKGFGDFSVDLDAIEPSRLRSIVDDALQRHLGPDELDALLVAEKDEQRLIHGLVGMVEDYLAEGSDGAP
ncbi:MAG: hypothetical protein U1E59_12365 [Amaricoccus sp.]